MTSSILFPFSFLLSALSLLVACVFGVTYFVAENHRAAPRTKARMGVLLASLYLAFLVLMTVFAVADAVMKRDARCLAWLVFVVIPFAIGRLVSYRTLKFYTIVQILSLLLSAATLCLV